MDLGNMIREDECVFIPSINLEYDLQCMGLTDYSRKAQKHIISRSTQVTKLGDG